MLGTVLGKHMKMTDIPMPSTYLGFPRTRRAVALIGHSYEVIWPLGLEMRDGGSAAGKEGKKGKEAFLSSPT